MGSGWRSRIELDSGSRNLELKQREENQPDWNTGGLRAGRVSAGSDGTAGSQQRRKSEHARDHGDHADACILFEHDLIFGRGRQFGGFRAGDGATGGSTRPRHGEWDAGLEYRNLTDAAAFNRTEYHYNPRHCRKWGQFTHIHGARDADTWHTRPTSHSSLAEHGANTASAWLLPPSDLIRPSGNAPSPGGITL